MMDEVSVEQVDPRRADVQRLINELDQYQMAMYPAESNHLDPASELSNSAVCFIGAYSTTELVGIGAIKYWDESPPYGEIKRVYVSEKMRGKGVSKRIMQHLEADAVSKNVFTVRLETGIYQPEAIGLYESLGYAKRDSFGDYPKDDPMSVFMEKTL